MIINMVVSNDKVCNNNQSAAFKMMKQCVQHILYKYIKKVKYIFYF